VFPGRVANPRNPCCLEIMAVLSYGEIESSNEMADF